MPTLHPQPDWAGRLTLRAEATDVPRVNLKVGCNALIVSQLPKPHIIAVNGCKAQVAHRYAVTLNTGVITVSQRGV